MFEGKQLQEVSSPFTF